MMLTWTLSGHCPAPLSCRCVVPLPSHHCCPVPSLAHMVVPLLSCVSVTWFGMDVRWGYSPWHPKIQNDNERQMSVIVRCLVAKSLSATWHLDAMLEGSVVGAGELLTSAHCHLVPFVCAGSCL